MFTAWDGGTAPAARGAKRTLYTFSSHCLAAPRKRPASVPSQLFAPACSSLLATLRPLTEGLQLAARLRRHRLAPRVSGQAIITPGSVVLPRKSSHVVHLFKAGYQDIHVFLNSELNPWFWGNIAIGGLVGIFVDLQRFAYDCSRISQPFHVFPGQLARFDGHSFIETALSTGAANRLSPKEENVVLNAIPAQESAPAALPSSNAGQHRLRPRRRHQPTTQRRRHMPPAVLPKHAFCFAQRSRSHSSLTTRKEIL